MIDSLEDFLRKERETSAGRTKREAEEKGAEKQRFVAEHGEEIAPLVEDNPTLDAHLKKLTADPKAKIPADDIDKILERFAVKIFFREKSPETYDPDAKRIGLSASDPLTLGTSRRLIQKLQADRRCRSIMLVVDNVAGIDYEKRARDDSALAGFRVFTGNEKEFPDEKESPTLAHLQELTAKEPVDVALAFIESKNSPSGSLLFEWKSEYGAKRLYLVDESWNGIGQRRRFYENIDSVSYQDPKTNERKGIDAIFCVDDMARDILIEQLPPGYAEKIKMVGIDPLPTANKAAEIRERGRKVLSIPNDTIVFSFFGDVPSDFASVGISVDPAINVRSLEKIIAGVSMLANNHPNKRYALLVRPHPRDGQENTYGELITLTHTASTPPNLMLVDASRKRLSNAGEAIYAGDAMLAISSTENFLAPRRGRESVFLGFGEPGLGKSVLELTFGENYKAILESRPHMNVIDSPEALAAVLEQVEPCKEIYPPVPVQKESATDRMLDEILGVRGDGR